jgi:tetratricopeptide (TPR) repeat protein
MTEAVAALNGRRLDSRYTLLDKLGVGGQGEVWRAHDETRGVDVALKLLNPALARNDAAWAALEHEHAIASRLDHPSILRVFPPTRSGDVVVLPMELAPGGDLRRLRGAGYLEIIPVLIEVAQALEHAHERGVVHRDLKPGNVLFDARGRVKLGDFGVAGTAADPLTRGLSPFTASPAQLRGEPPAPADDVYGLGALAYELLSGYPPYYPHFDIKRAQEEPVPELVPTRQIPPLLSTLVMRMLEKRPEKRPHTMRDVIDELDAALNDTLTFDLESAAPFAAGFGAGTGAGVTGAGGGAGSGAGPNAGGGAAALFANPTVPAGPDGVELPQWGARPQPAPAARSATPATLVRSPVAAPAAMPGRDSTASVPRQPAAREATGQPAPTEVARQPVRPEVVRPSVPPDVTRPAVPPEVTRPAVPPEVTRPAVPPEVTRSAVPPEATRPAVPPEATRPAVREAARSPVPPEAVTPPVPPEVTSGAESVAERPPWDDLKLEAIPRPTRLEPMPTRPGWPVVLLGVLVGVVAVVFYWLPRYAPDLLPPQLSISGSAHSGEDGSTTAGGPGSGSTAAQEGSNGGREEPGAGAGSREGARADAGQGVRGGVAAGAGESARRGVGAGAGARADTFDPAAEAKLKSTRETFDRRLETLDNRGAGVWGGPDYALAKTRAAESVGAHDAGNTKLAQARLDAAMQLLNQVEARASQALASQVEAGDKALAAGQEDVATHAYDLAKRIDPTDRRVMEGERRARKLGGVLPLLADAQNAEAAHNYSRAAQDYSQALALDPGSATARTGLARANAAFGDDSYAKAVGTGFAALGAGRLDDAREAFEQARKFKPNGSEAAEGLRRVGAALTARNFASIRQRAAGLEAQERWDEAVQAYDSALQTDPSLVFAQQGKARAQARADLARSLQALLDRPERLASASVREEARNLLQTAEGQTPSGPVLRSQIARLELMLPEFDKPVRLWLVSDNATQVAIPSIGSFGTFAKREIELKPGKYTVIGTRNGYRDVRRDVTIVPGQENQTISVTCSEPI